MPAKRIVPCLDVRNGVTVKGVSFGALREVGDPVEHALRYIEEGADELVFLDITAHREGKPVLYELIGRLARELTIPFTVGGGISSLKDAQEVLDAGADKISINSAAVTTPDIVDQIATTFGSQALCVAIDSLKTEYGHRVYIRGGTQATPNATLDWAREVYDRGAGEVLLTSIAHDGNRSGFDIELVSDVSQSINIPVIASGGAGSATDFVALFSLTGASAGLAAGIFHDRVTSIGEVKAALRSSCIEVRI